jgi:hypothetical protein
MTLSVYLFPVPDVEDRYLATSVIYEINDPVISLPYPIAIDVSGEFFSALRPRGLTASA